MGVVRFASAAAFAAAASVAAAVAAASFAFAVALDEAAGTCVRFEVDSTCGNGFICNNVTRQHPTRQRLHICKRTLSCIPF